MVIEDGVMDLLFLHSINKVFILTKRNFPFPHFISQLQIYGGSQFWWNVVREKKTHEVWIALTFPEI